MTVYRMDLAYDGSAYRGYAIQPGVRTVQGDLETALAHHVADLKTVVAGRTDAGVHATGQVVSFEAESLDCVSVMRSLNAQLDGSTAVLSLGEASHDFDARFSAVGRRYEYSILNREAPDPFLGRTAWLVEWPLDVDLMNRAMEPLVGLHDFAAFCRKAASRSSERRLDGAIWSREGDVLTLDIWASSFCHQMVRSIARVAVDVGRGRADPSVSRTILESMDRQASFGSAPPHGLTLVEVMY